MMYTSTRDKEIHVSFKEALHLNLSHEGGLFVPVSFPKLDIEDLSRIDSYPEFAFQLLKNFVDYEDEKLREICKRAFNFPLVITELNSTCSELELYHGPTNAFKDFGARFLAECIEVERGLVLVATSGDTGGAVADAFWNKKNIDVVILFPDKKVSKRQEHQLTSYGANIHSYAIQGTFDDCQGLVKKTFNKKTKGLISANSVNLGRILPQMVYYAYVSLRESQRQKGPIQFIIPTGNVGNSCAALWAYACGFPIKKIVLATNANQTLNEYFQTNKYQPRKSIETLANAMDVGSPSNFERVLDYFNNDFESLKKVVDIFSVSDVEIKNVIVDRPFKRIVCPHTACAYAIYFQHYKNEMCVIVSTAHPAKFETIVNPLIGEEVIVPPQLLKALSRKSSFEVLSLPEIEKSIELKISELN